MITEPTEDMIVAAIEASRANVLEDEVDHARAVAAAVLVVAENPLRIEGYEKAIAILQGVAQRTGSPAAKWAAEYLGVDPDKEGPRRSGPDEDWGDHPLQEAYPGSGIYE